MRSSLSLATTHESRSLSSDDVSLEGIAGLGTVGLCPSGSKPSESPEKVATTRSEAFTQVDRQTWLKGFPPKTGLSTGTCEAASAAGTLHLAGTPLTCIKHFSLSLAHDR